MLTTNTLSAFFMILFGIFMYVIVIPAQIEEPMFANHTTPSTVPNIAVLGIIVFAIIQLIENLEPIPIDSPLLFRTIGFGILGVIAVWAMTYAHFPIIAPILSATTMAFIGERRPKVFAWGIFIPIAVWYCVEILLLRPLP